MSKEYTPDSRGYISKYVIYRRNVDGSQGEEILGPTFTLRPYDPHARKAMRVYADSVQEENAQLAEDLRKIVEDEENEYVKRCANG